MIDFFRGKRAKGEAGSMVVALFVTIMFLVLSVGIASVVVSQIAQNRAEDTARVGQWALTSAISQAAEKIGPAARALSGVATTEPTTWTSQGINNNNAFSRWWVSSSSNAVLNPSILPTGNWSAVSYGNNVWVGINTAGAAFTSSDGVNWTQRNNLPNYTTLTYSNMIYGLGYFIAIPSTASNTVATSVDGITWTAVTLPASDTYTVACSTTTCVFLSLTTTLGYYTSNVSTFTGTATPFVAEDVSFSVDNFVMSGSGSIASSTSGAAWSTRVISNHNWGLIGSINGLFTAFDVKATGSNIIATSSDAITWTDRTLPASGNWVAAVTAAPQEAVFSNAISGVAQSTYLATSDGLSWVSSNLLASGSWTGASASTNGFVVYSSGSSSAYFIPVTSGVSSAQSLTVTARAQSGRVSGSNNAQYMASMVYNWNASKKRWIASKYLGASSASLSAKPGSPTGVSGTRTATGTIVVSWVAPVNTGSSSITSYLATASPGGYYCTNGGQLSGTTCTLTTATAATYTAAFYSCTSGDSPAGTQASSYTCTHSTTYSSAYTAGAYSCTSGDTPSGTQTSPFTCTHTTTYSALFAPAGYSCTTGDTPGGSQASAFTCTHQISGATYHVGSYSCTSGDSPSGTQITAFTCTHSASSTYSAPVLLAGAYNCVSPAVLVGSNCVTTAVALIVCATGYTAGGGGSSGTIGNCYKQLGGGAESHQYWNCPGGYQTVPSMAGGWMTSSTQYPVTDDPVGYWSPGGTPGANGGLDAYANRTCVPNGVSYQAPVSINPSSGYPVISITCKNSGGYTAVPIPILWGQDPQIPGFAANPGHPSPMNNYYTMCSGITYPATVGPTTYSCPSGGTQTYNSGSGTWYCYAAATYIPNSYSPSTYSCTSPDTLSGSTCTHTTSTLNTYPATGTMGCSSGTLTYNSSGGYYTCNSTSTSGPSYTAAYCSDGSATQAICLSPPAGTWYPAHYNCPSGYSPSGNVTAATVCTQTTINGTISIYSCAPGDTLSGSTCSYYTTSTSTYNASGGPASYYCSSGTPAGSGSTMTCMTYAGLNYTATTVPGTASCSGSDTLAGSVCTVAGGGYPTNGFANNDWCGGIGSSSADFNPTYPYVTASSTNGQAGPNGVSCYNVTIVTASCTSPAVLSGSNCVTTVAAPFTATTYQCTSGDSPSGVQSSAVTCTHTATSTYTSSGTAAYYSCSSGTLSGTNCISTYTSTGTAAFYYCTSGDTPATNSSSTFTCTHNGAYGSPGIPAYYSCTSGDSPSGTQVSSFTCTHNATYTSIRTAAYYSCFSGTLAGNVCLFNTAATALYNSGGYTCNSTGPLNCTITGMATGSYTFTVTATNGVGTSDPSVASSGVQSTAMSITYPSQVFSTTQFSQVLPIMVQNSSGGSMTYSESGSLPSGVTFSNASGAFTGPSSWASQVGYPFTVSVSATDAGSGVTVTTPVTFTLITP